MNVSPLDLRQQRFRSRIRGFDKVEVASFLIAVALVVLFGLCLCWTSVLVGMLVKSPGAVPGVLIGIMLALPQGVVPAVTAAWASRRRRESKP